MRTFGIDYGTVRIGVAVSDELGMIATGRETLQVKSVAEAVAGVAAVVQEREAGRVVVGLPLNMDGSRGPMVEAVERFIKKLAAVIDVPIDVPTLSENRFVGVEVPARKNSRVPLTIFTLVTLS